CWSAPRSGSDSRTTSRRSRSRPRGSARSRSASRRGRCGRARRCGGTRPMGRGPRSNACGRRRAVPAAGRALPRTPTEAPGGHAGAAVSRGRMARAWPTSIHLTLWAASLGQLGRVDEALAVMPDAVAAIRHHPAATLAWILLQWARLHEQRGEPAAARRLLEEARRRMPGHVEGTAHLADAIRATGGDPSALLASAVATDPHPELLALAGRTAEARAAWERHVAALPEAFAEHAARFYLREGADPRRALALARESLSHRSGGEARTLVV